MKICCLMLYDQNHAEMGRLSSTLVNVYSARHGYSSLVYTDLLETTLNPSWNKIVAIRRHLQNYDWVFWIDADTLICNSDLRLESLIEANASKSIIISEDCNGICCGVFLIKNCPWSIWFLDTLLALGSVGTFDASDGRDTWEQSSVKCLHRNFPSVNAQFGTIPEAIVRNPRTAQNGTAPFIMHYWASGISKELAEKQMRACVAEGWKT